MFLIVERSAKTGVVRVLDTDDMKVDTLKFSELQKDYKSLGFSIAGMSLEPCQIAFDGRVATLGSSVNESKFQYPKWLKLWGSSSYFNLSSNFRLLDLSLTLAKENKYNLGMLIFLSSWQTTAGLLKSAQSSFLLEILYNYYKGTTDFTCRVKCGYDELKYTDCISVKVIPYKSKVFFTDGYFVIEVAKSTFDKYEETLKKQTKFNMLKCDGDFTLRPDGYYEIEFVENLTITGKEGVKFLFVGRSRIYNLVIKKNAKNYKMQAGKYFVLQSLSWYPEDGLYKFTNRNFEAKSLKISCGVVSEFLQAVEAGHLKFGSFALLDVDDTFNMQKFRDDFWGVIEGSKHPSNIRLAMLKAMNEYFKSFGLEPLSVEGFGVYVDSVSMLQALDLDVNIAFKLSNLSVGSLSQKEMLDTLIRQDMSNRLHLASTYDSATRFPQVYVSQYLKVWGSLLSAFFHDLHLFLEAVNSIKSKKNCGTYGEMFEYEFESLSQSEYDMLCNYKNRMSNASLSNRLERCIFFIEFDLDEYNK